MYPIIQFFLVQDSFKLFYLFYFTLENLDDVGKNMLDIEDTVFILVFVNDKLTCELPIDMIEVPYHVVFADPLCFFVEVRSI